MAGSSEDDDRPSHPYRTPVDVPVAPPSSHRSPKSKVLSALATISAANGGAEEISETLSQRAAHARTREAADALDVATSLQRRHRRAAHIAFETERWETAEEEYRLLVQWDDEAGDPVLDDLVAWATTLRQLRRWSESEPLFRRATSLREPLRDEAPIVAVHDLGVLLVHLGRFGAARAILERALERATFVQSRSPGDAALQEIARLHHALAECLLDDDDVLAARPHVDRALALRAEMDGSDGAVFGATLATAARILHTAGDIAGAESSYARAIDLTRVPSGHTMGSAQVMVLLASSFADRGRLHDAELLVDEALQTLRRAGPDHAFQCRALRVRARIEGLAGRHQEAATTQAKIARILTLWGE